MEDGTDHPNSPPTKSSTTTSKTQGGRDGRSERMPSPLRRGKTLDNADLTLMKASRPPEEELKNRCFAQTMHSATDLECGPTCTFGRRCLIDTNLAVLLEMRNALWGERGEKPPNQEEKTAKIVAILNSAWQSNKSDFEFLVPEGARPPASQLKRKVCEAGMLKILGLSTGNLWASDAPRPWLKAKNRIIDPTKAADEDFETFERRREKKKTEHATEFITHMGDLSADVSPGEFTTIAIFHSTF